MIESADEYSRLQASGDAGQRRRVFHEEASAATWREVIARFPEFRRDVAMNRPVPYEVLAELRHDPDESVQWAVRSRETWVRIHPEDAMPSSDDPSKMVQLRLSDQERYFLRCGLTEWGGPGSCTEEFARAMGFDSVIDLHDTGTELALAIERGEPLRRVDWVRALLATEVVFASDVVGSGSDWSVTTGFTDAESVRLLRTLQSKIPTGGVVAVAFGTRAPASI